MPGLADFDCEGVLTISSISMNRAAWMISGDETGQSGLLPLWVFAEQRGADRELPGVAGVLAYRRRTTATRHDLRLIVVGDVDLAGNPIADSRAGLAANLAYIYSSIVAPTNVTNGTRPATLTVFGQTIRTAAIHVLGLQHQSSSIGLTQSIFEGTLQISIPDGRFV